MAARARADFALPFGIGQIFIARDIAGAYLAAVISNHSGTRGKTEPVAVGIAKVRRDALD